MFLFNIPKKDFKNHERKFFLHRGAPSGTSRGPTFKKRKISETSQIEIESPCCHEVSQLNTLTLLCCKFM